MRLEDGIPVRCNAILPSWLQGVRTTASPLPLGGCPACLELFTILPLSARVLLVDGQNHFHEFDIDTLDLRRAQQGACCHSPPHRALPNVIKFARVRHAKLSHFCPVKES